MNDEQEPARVKVVTTELVSVAVTPGDQMTSPRAVAPILIHQIGRKDREHFVTLHLDARNRVLSVETVSVGSLVASLVHPREVFKSAILQNAAGIICGHNHPSGDCSPSAEDYAIHTRLKEAGRLLGIDVIDFLIVAGESWTAFSELSGKEVDSATHEPGLERARAADRTDRGPAG